METYFALPRFLRDRRRRVRLFWILLVAANVVAVVSIWYTNSNYYILNPGEGNIFKALGRLAGLFFELAILTLLLLIGRIRSLEQAFGFDRLNTLHRWIGYSIGALLIIHPLFLSIGGAMANQISVVNQFASFLATWQNVFLAFIAFVLFIYIILLSLPFSRRRFKYETWYGTHLLNYLAIVLAFSHQINTGDMARAPYLYYWVILNFTVFGLVLVYRFVRPLGLFGRYRFRIEKIVQENHNTYSIYINGRGIGRFRFRAGQYANIFILSRGLWFAHPFSFSKEYDGQSIRFTAKSVGDFTNKIKTVPLGTKVIIDGPLGLFTADTSEREKMLLIAGGIGITPLRSLAGEAVRNAWDISLLYSAKNVGDLVFKDELESLRRERYFPIHYILTSGVVGYESGRIDKAKIVKSVPDFFERDIFICGPQSLMTSMTANLVGLGVPKSSIHYEKFSF